jgi:sensor histidine kinase YesM
MIIQPVVENSILHGIYPKAFGGEVFVNIDISDEKIKIEVKDTGIGIDSETVENIFKHNNKSLGTIYKRLNNIYNGNFKLIITSRIEDGTSVIMELPSKNITCRGIQIVD